MRQAPPKQRRPAPPAHTARLKAIVVAVAAAGAGLLGLRGLGPDDVSPPRVDAAEAGTRAVIDERLGHHLERLR